MTDSLGSNPGPAHKGYIDLEKFLNLFVLQSSYCQMGMMIMFTSWIKSNLLKVNI